MASPFLYFADDRLTLAELSAACLDGDLVGLGDAFIPADAVETAALRAGTLVPRLGTTLAATHLSAAWVFGALHAPPARHTVQRVGSRRRNRLPHRLLVYRDLEIAAVHLLRIGDVWVTSPARTIADLARVDDAAHRRAALLLGRSDPAAAAAAIEQLETGTLPHKREALAFLRSNALGVRTAGGAGQDEVTRYTS